MKVSELIETLQHYDPDMEVMISYQSSDYWRTQVADTVDEIEEAEVEYSDYHEKFRVVEDEDDRDDLVYPKMVLLIG